MKYHIKDLNERARGRPQGYYDDVMSKSRLVESNIYEISDEDYAQLAVKYRSPTFNEKIKNLLSSVGEAVMNPESRNSEDILACASICNKCPYFVVENFQCGLCGCNLNYKMKLKIWHCPINNW